jgi:hypothetical protein
MDSRLSGSPRFAPTRRATLAAIAFAGCPPWASAADARDWLGIPGPLTFDGTPFALAWSARPAPAYYKQEYLPAGQASASYTRMLLIEVVESGTTVAGALSAQVRMLNARKGKDPLVNFEVIQNRRTGEVMLDFIIGGRTAAGVPIAEWNAYRYAPRKSASGGEGVLLFAISHRAYGDADIRTFLTGLKAMRPAEINRIAQYRLPDARIAT